MCKNCTKPKSADHNAGLYYCTSGIDGHFSRERLDFAQECGDEYRCVPC